ncbi:MAG TPA: kelch repeat-containing protein [Ktedonobacteraceae bacterium]
MSTPEKSHWIRQNPALYPPFHKAGSMAYDAVHQVSLLFGGGGNNDTWIWNGKSWRELTPVQSPPARMNASMVYNTAQKHIVLFGGMNNSGQLLNDTWIWDGSNWSQVYTANAPTARSGASMAYDDIRQQVILFGGQANDQRFGALLNDTWIWDGTMWRSTNPSTPPVARQGASLTNCTAGQHLILFGGSAGHMLLDDTWTWNGIDWQEHTPTVRPSARAWAAMTYKTHARQAILIGGGGEGNNTMMPAALGDTWAWSGVDWQPLTSSLLPSAGDHCAVYDEARQVITLYATTGSKTVLDNTTSTNATSDASIIASFQSETWLLP